MLANCRLAEQECDSGTSEAARVCDSYEAAQEDLIWHRTISFIMFRAGI